ncbi:MAG: septal ring lytic transglycosylase RlpA family protein [Candidatus Cyclobacteriaceae bacterium M3_2C_046]
MIPINRIRFSQFIILIFFVLLISCKKDEEPYSQTGYASYYANSFEGQETSSGEIYQSEDMTAAHKFLPLGTKIRVTNLENNQSIQVTVNDRGPYAQNRILDLSKAAAEKLNFVEEGETKVEIEVLQAAEGYTLQDSVARDRVDELGQF